MNRSRALVVAACAGFAIAATAQAQVFSSSPAMPIPATGTTGTNSTTLSVAGGPAVITDVNVILDITHTFDGDLDIILVPPSGDTYVHLTSDSGGLGDNFTFTRFDQQSTVVVSANVAPAVAPFNATLQPEGGDVAWRAGATILLPGPSLANLDSLIGTNSNGNWTIIIDDDAGGDVGTLNYWSLEFNGAIDPQGPSFGLPPVATGGAANPNPVIEGQSVVFTINVAPGTAPASTGLSVTGDASVWGGPSSVAFNDSGNDGDAVAGDGTWSATIQTGAFPGARTLPIAITDDQGRNATSTIAFTISPSASGACCVGSDCSIVREIECAALSGTFTAGADCGSISYEVSTSASTFTSIAGVGTQLANTNADDGVALIDIGFTFNYNGVAYTQVNVVTNGNIQFPPNNSNDWTNDPIPTAAVPNNFIAPFWDDFDLDTVDGGGELYSFLDTSGGVGNYTLTISWEGAEQYFNLGDSNDFQVVLFENGNFEFRYGNITPEATAADYTIGYENATGTAGVQIPSADIGAGNTARLFTFVQGAGPCEGGSTCPGCAADYDQDGGVTGGDIGAFFTDFEQGLPCADVDQDGGITGGDIGAFFQVFEAGGC